MCNQNTTTVAPSRPCKLPEKRPTIALFPFSGCLLPFVSVWQPRHNRHALFIRKSIPILVKQPQPRAACRCNLSATIRAGVGRRGQRQNPRAHHAHRMAAAKPNGERAQHFGGNVHQQSRQRNANAAGCDAAAQFARHVVGHVSRFVPPLFAFALPRSRLAANLPNFRQQRPTLAD